MHWPQWVREPFNLTTPPQCSLNVPMSRRRMIPVNTSNYARWLARRIEEAYRGISLGPEAAMFVGMALNGYADRLDEKEASTLAFMVTALERATAPKCWRLRRMFRSHGRLSKPPFRRGPIRRSSCIRARGYWASIRRRRNWR